MGATEANGFRIPLLFQMADAGLKVFAAAGGGLCGGFALLPLQVFEICFAIPATDPLDVEADIFRRLFVHHSQQELPQFFATEARDAVPPPDRSQPVHPRVLLAAERGEALVQIGVVSQFGFDFSHLRRGERFIEKGLQIGIGSFGHTYSA